MANIIVSAAVSVASLQAIDTTVTITAARTLVCAPFMCTPGAVATKTT